MFNFLDKIKGNPDFFRQLALDGQLITQFNCPLETKKEKTWSEESYFVYVVEGKKIWHIPGKSYEMTEGKCIFEKKGAHIIEQFFDSTFCVVIFFLSDSFIKETILSIQASKLKISTQEYSSPISEIHADDSLHAFFNSVVPYFLDHQDASKELLELKFRELILNVISNPRNQELKNYFCSLLNDSYAESLRKTMEEDFHSNLGLDEFARLCGRSLSAFKRDVEELYNTTPGRWLLNRRLQHARLLIGSSSLSVSEIAFECGFENNSHFSRAFKEHFGAAPVNFRQDKVKTLEQRN